MTSPSAVASIVAPMVASLPSPSFDSIELGPLTLRMYGLMIALGVIAAVWLAGRRLAERGWGTSDDASAMAMWGVAGGIVGARLYHVITDWERFEDNLGDIPKIWEGGLGIPGGIALGIVFGAYAGKQRGIPVPVQFTIVAPALPLAQAIGRWGNWFNQELYGRPTDLPWALEIDPEHNGDYPDGTTFHPAFLYESLWNLALCGLLLWIDRRWGDRITPGKLLAGYVLGYGVGRLWIESLRIDPANEIAGLRVNQWLSMALIAGGVFWLIAGRSKPWPEPPRRTPDDGDAGEAPGPTVDQPVDGPAEDGTEQPAGAPADGPAGAGPETAPVESGSSDEA